MLAVIPAKPVPAKTGSGTPSLDSRHCGRTRRERRCLVAASVEAEKISFEDEEVWGKALDFVWHGHVLVGGSSVASGDGPYPLTVYLRSVFGMRADVHGQDRRRCGKLCP